MEPTFQLEESRWTVAKSEISIDHFSGAVESKLGRADAPPSGDRLRPWKSQEELDLDEILGELGHQLPERPQSGECLEGLAQSEANKIAPGCIEREQIASELISKVKADHTAANQEIERAEGFITVFDEQEFSAKVASEAASMLYHFNRELGNANQKFNHLKSSTETLLQYLQKVLNDESPSQWQTSEMHQHIQPDGCAECSFKEEVVFIKKTIQEKLAELAKTKLEITNMQAIKTILEEQVTSLENELEVRTQSSEEQSIKVQELEKMLAQQEETSKRYCENARNLTAQLDATNTKANDYEADLKNLQERVDSLRVDLEAKNAEVDALEIESESLKQQLDESDQAHDQQVEKFSELEKIYSQLKAALAQKNQQLMNALDLEFQNTQLKNANIENKTQLNRLQVDLEQKTAKISDLNDLNNRLETENAEKDAKLIAQAKELQEQLTVVSDLQATVTNLSARGAEADSKLQSALATSLAHAKELSKREEENSNLKQQQHEKDSKLEAEMQKSQEQGKRIADLQIRMKQLAEENASIQYQQQELQKLSAKIVDLEKTNQAITAAHEDEKNKSRSRLLESFKQQKMITDLENNVGKLTAACSAKDSELQKQTKISQQQTSEIEELKKLIGSFKRSYPCLFEAHRNQNELTNAAPGKPIDEKNGVIDNRLGNPLADTKRIEEAKPTSTFMRNSFDSRGQIQPETSSKLMTEPATNLQTRPKIVRVFVKKPAMDSSLTNTLSREEKS